MEENVPDWVVPDWLAPERLAGLRIWECLYMPSSIGARGSLVPAIEPMMREFDRFAVLLFGSLEKDPLIEAFDPQWSGALPYTVLIAEDGKILYRKEGAIDPRELKRSILAAVRWERPSPRIQ